MKKYSQFMLLVLCLTFVINLTSCLVYVKEGKGHHYGWFKNPHNPHNPFRINPIIFNGNGNGNGNGHEKNEGHGNGHGHQK